MTLSDAMIEEVITRYQRERDLYEKLTDYVATECRELLRESVVQGTVQSRVKDSTSLRGKLERDRERYDTVADVFAKLSDFAAVRIATYVESDRPRVCSAIVERFANQYEHEVEIEQKELEAPEKFYRATHCQITLTGPLARLYENLLGETCEVQVCSLLAHVWNELEHDLVYKKLRGTLGPAEEAALLHLGHLVRAGDGLIQVLVDATALRLQETRGEFIAEWDFTARLAGWFPGAVEFSSRAGQLLQELRAAGLSSPEAIREALFPGVPDADIEAVAIAAMERIAPLLTDTNLRLEPTTSDPLLAAFVIRFAAEVDERRPRIQGKPQRIYSIAKRVLESLPPAAP